MVMDYLYSIGRQTWHEFRYWGGRGLARLMRTPLPRVFLLCIAAALVLAILPLTLMLFFTFLVLKIVFTLLVVAGRRGGTRQLHDK